MHKIYIFCLAIIAALNVSAQAPIFNSVTPNATSVARGEKFQVDADLSAIYTNPFNYDDIAVQCTFTSPGGVQYVVDGFYQSPYSLNTADGSLSPNGPAAFSVRFTPNQVGTWQYVLSCISTAGTTTLPAQNFTCTSAGVPGFIRTTGNGYLQFDDGTPYIPVGENMAWHNNNIYSDYTNWINKLSSAKGNFIRVWMPSWGFGLEWKNNVNGFSGLEKYKQTSAYYLDWLLDYCHQRNVYVMLSLNNHGQVSTTVNPEWPDNPYNAANGGPCNNTWDFFTNDSARSIFKNRLRYIVARYGYSANIMSWELFNEVDWTDDFAHRKTDVSNWHAEMAGWLKQLDINSHLVTTSYANEDVDPQTWALDGIDFTQTHHYASSAHIEAGLAADNIDYRQQYQKPTLNGEFSINVNQAPTAEDTTGIHLHNSLWASLFSGAMGSAMTWWWDTYVDKANLYYHFTPISTILQTLPITTGTYAPARAAVIDTAKADNEISPGYAAFNTSPGNSFTVNADGTLTPASNKLGQYLFGQTYNTQYRNPPVFSVTYAVAGQFIVHTGKASGASPKISVTIDNNNILLADAKTDTSYTVSVAAGSHSIAVDNPGTDWILIDSYTFTKQGPSLLTYTMQAADSNSAYAWLLNTQYNWKYVLNHAGALPAPVKGAKLLLTGMTSGTYAIHFYNCETGNAAGDTSVYTHHDSLSIPLPTINWDAALTATYTGPVTAVIDPPASVQLRVYPNPAFARNITVEYDLNEVSQVSISLYNMGGAKVATIANETQYAGPHKITYRGTNKLATGVYLAVIKLGKYTKIAKVIFP